MMHCSTSFTERCLVSTSLFSCSAAESSIFDVGSSFFTSTKKSAKIGPRRVSYKVYNHENIWKLDKTTILDASKSSNRSRPSDGAGVPNFTLRLWKVQQNTPTARRHLELFQATNHTERQWPLLCHLKFRAFVKCIMSPFKAVSGQIEDFAVRVLSVKLVQNHSLVHVLPAVFIRAPSLSCVWMGLTPHPPFPPTVSVSDVTCSLLNWIGTHLYQPLHCYQGTHVARKARAKSTNICGFSMPGMCGMAILPSVCLIKISDRSKRCKTQAKLSNISRSQQHDYWLPPFQ